MLLKGEDFGHCWDMSGVRGFFGEGYAYHQLLKPVGLSFRRSTFVSKTTTLLRRDGNMPLDTDGITPMEFKPECIKVDFLKGVVLNAVGLSGPGAEFLFNDGRWQERTRPWVLSFMSVLSRAERRRELQEFILMLKKYLPGFKARIVFQQNFSCVNVKGMTHEVEEVIDEAEESFALVANELPDLPQVPKLNVLMPPVGAFRLANHPYCSGLCVSNTIKWGDLSHIIDWKQFFDGTGISPLVKFGGGGLSGKPLLPLVIDWVQAARKEGMTKPIVAGGGILGPKDAEKVLRAGASAIAVGSMSMLRPWRMQKTIDRANHLKAFGR